MSKDHDVASKSEVPLGLDCVEHNRHVAWAADGDRVDGHRVRQVGPLAICCEGQGENVSE